METSKSNVWHEIGKSNPLIKKLTEEIDNLTESLREEESVDNQLITLSKIRDKVNQRYWIHNGIING